MIVFLLEEPSMAELLKVLLPQMLPNEEYRLVPHTGKDDLKMSIPIKLKAWSMPNTRFVIVHDQDNNDCVQLKKEIETICAPYHREVLIRIVCRELESWYFGDLEAVEKAYGKNLSKLKNSPKYRDTDDIPDPKYVLRKYIPELTQINGAKMISRYMNPDNNKSHSFKVFCEGIKKL